MRFSVERLHFTRGWRVLICLKFTYPVSTVASSKFMCSHENINLDLRLRHCDRQNTTVSRTDKFSNSQSRVSGRFWIELDALDFFLINVPESV